MSEVRKSKLAWQEIAAYAVIAVMSVLIMFNFDENTFWYDECCTISFIRLPRSFSDLISIFLKDEVTNPPLYDIFLYFWYRLVPHDQTCLLFPNLLFYDCGLFFLIKTVKRISEDKNIILFLSMSALINSFALRSVIFELRSYALLYMFASILIYLFVINEICKRPGKLSHFMQGGVMLCISMTHYFGLLFAGTIFLSALILRIIRKEKKGTLSFLVSQIFPFILAGAWLVAAMLKKEKSVATFWVAPPGLKDIIGVINSVLGRNEIFTVISCVAILAYLICMMIRRVRGEAFVLFITALSCSMAVFLADLVYSAFINPAGGLFVPRYFVAVMPCVQLLTAFSFSGLTGFFCEKTKKKTAVCAAAAAAIAVILIAGGAKRIYEAFNEYINEGLSAEEIYEFMDEHGDEAATVVKERDGVMDAYAADGWIEYYFRERGRKVYSSDDTDQYSDRKYLAFFPQDPEEYMDEDFMSGYTEIERGFYMKRNAK